MSDSLAMTISSTSLVANTASATPSQRTASLNSEQNLIDYLAHLQSQGSATQGFTNPTGLAGEAGKLLKGYLERANSLNDKASQRMNRMTQSANLELAPENGGEAEALPDGPASQSLVASIRSDAEQAGDFSKVTMNELTRLSEVLTETMKQGAETTIISTAASNIGKSITTLLHG